MLWSGKAAVLQTIQGEDIVSKGIPVCTAFVTTFMSPFCRLVRMICVKFRVNRSLFITGLKLGRLIQFGSLNIFRVGGKSDLTSNSRWPPVNHALCTNMPS